MSGIIKVQIKLESGEVLQDETFPLENGVVRQVSKNFTNVTGEEGSIVFTFDPPLIVPKGADE